MVGIILATHGDFAKGILQSGSMIFGDQPNVAAVTLQPSEGPADIRAKMEEAVASFDDPDQVLIMVDLWGGTPFNQANGLIDGHEDTWAIVAGLNLPMLIDAYASRMTMETAHEIAVQISGSGKDGVKIYPESLEPKKEEAAPVQAAAPQGAIRKERYWETDTSSSCSPVSIPDCSMDRSLPHGPRRHSRTVSSLYLTRYPMMTFVRS